MKTTKLVFSILAGSVIFASCGKKNDSSSDSVPPEVQNVLINGVSEIDTVNVGETISISASFSDNQELGKLKIFVEALNHTSNWSELKHVDLSGTSQQVKQNIEVISNAKEGSYVTRLEFTDASGNLSKHSLNSFEVKNGSTPEILNLEARFDNGTYNHETGDTLRIYGQVKDDEDIQLVSVHVRVPADYDTTHTTFYQQKFPMNEPGNTKWDFNEDGQVKIYFSPLSKPGDYTISILAVDNKNNSASRYIGVDI